MKSPPSKLRAELLLDLITDIRLESPDRLLSPEPSRFPFGPTRDARWVVHHCDHAGDGRARAQIDGEGHLAPVNAVSKEGNVRAR